MCHIDPLQRIIRSVMEIISILKLVLLKVANLMCSLYVDDVDIFTNASSLHYYTRTLYSRVTTHIAV
jgi:hypothetical protein